MMQPPAGSRRPSTSAIIALILIVTLGIVTVVGALTAFQLPHPVTEQGRDVERLYIVTLVISFIVFFGVTSGIIWAIFRYRRRGPEMPVQIHGSSSLEMIWTVIPILILVALFVPSLILVLDLKTPPAEAEADVVIEVIGHQWWWEFDYKDQNVKVQATPPNYANLDPPRLVVPINKTVLLKIRSTDVIHSFYAPQMLYKIQAIPGNVNEMHFKVEEAGSYTGQCYQFCGLRHSDMRWILDARSETDYARWLQEAKQGATPR